MMWKILFFVLSVSATLVLDVNALNGTYTAVKGSCQYSVGPYGPHAWSLTFLATSDPTKYKIAKNDEFCKGSGTFDALTGAIFLLCSESFSCSGVIQVNNPVYGFQVLCNIANLGFCDFYYGCTGSRCAPALHL